MHQLLQHIGNRIRLYRTNKNMSMDELAKKIHKSKSSVSKYESGQISIDIITLFDIAKALDISLFQIFDYKVKKRLPDKNSPFGKQDQLYLYHMYRKRIIEGIL